MVEPAAVLQDLKILTALNVTIAKCRLIRRGRRSRFEDRELALKAFDYLDGYIVAFFLNLVILIILALTGMQVFAFVS